MIHFFALGVKEAYKTLTFDDIFRVMQHPGVLLRDEYLRAINCVLPCLREDLTDVLLKCVDPDDDPFDVVLDLHRAMQENNLFGQVVIATAKKDEKISAREFSKLISHLENQPLHSLDQFDHKGMKEIVRT